MRAPTLRYAWYATAVLMVAYTFSFLDRQILNLMVGPIEHDLGIGDSQFAILIPSAIQMVAPNRLRGQLGALFLFTVGIIGVSCGPILPALFTDYVFKSHDSLRYSLAWSTGLVGPCAFGVLWLGLRQYRTRFQEMASYAGA